MEDYTQPFCILGSKGKFHHSYRFYLPPLEQSEPPAPEPTPIKVQDTRSLRDGLQKLQAHLNYVTNKINKHIDMSKRKRANAFNKNVLVK